MKTGFAGRRTLITGASSGLGRELAFVLAARGATLALAARNQAKLQAVACEIANGHPNSPAPIVIPTDITVESQVTAMIDQCQQAWGGLEVLINNAGAGVYGESRLMSPADIESVMRVNFLGASWTMLRALPLLQRSPSGMIVNIASAAAIHGVPFLSAYSASKAALVSFSQALRAELAGAETGSPRIALVYPGYIQTDFFDHEKRVGTARRPRGPYLPASLAARQIANDLEHGKTEIYLTRESHALTFAQRFVPSLVNRAMARLATQLLSHPERNSP